MSATRACLFLSALLCSAAAQSYADYFNSNCGGVETPQVDFSPQTIASYRDQSWTDLQENYQAMFRFLMKERTSSAAIEAALPYSALLITMICLSAALALLVIGWSYGVFRKLQRNVLAEWVCLIAACSLFWAFLALFAAIVVFLGLSLWWKAEGFCLFFKIPVVGAFGAARTRAGPAFLGLKNLNDTVANFGRELADWKLGKLDIEPILAADFGPPLARLNSSLAEVYRQFSGSLVTFPDGEGKIPSSIAGLLDFQLSGDIADELETINRAASDLRKSAALLANFRSEPSLLAAMRSDFRDYAVQNAYLWAVFNATWTTLTSKLAASENLVPVSAWILFSLGLLLAAALAAALAVACRVCCRRQWLAKLRPAKLLLVVASVLVVLWFVLCLVQLVGVLVVSGHCHVIRQLAGPPANATVLDDVGVELPEAGKVFWRRCVDQRANPNVLDLAAVSPQNSLAVKNFVGFVDGLTSYAKFLAAFPDDAAPALARTLAQWRLLRDGLVADNSDVESGLSQLNQAVRCTGKRYALKAAGCAAGDCLGIFDTATAPLDGCIGANQTAVVQKFQNLKSHITDMDSVFGRLGAAAADSPARAFAEAARRLKAVRASFVAVQAAFPRTFASAFRHGDTFSKTTGCRVFLDEFRNAEYSVCFKQQRFSYTMLVLSCVAGLLLFLLCLALCCTLHQQDSLAPPALPPPLVHVLEKPPAPVFKFDDVEQTPVY